ncbi:MAG: hypothetical protein LAT76_12700 [Schleiferiaceae bacterium]|nr:hypothetical protein [Schleiferiaceae bacterium]
MSTFFSRLFNRNTRPVPSADLFTASADELSQLRELTQQTTAPVVIQEEDFFQHGFHDGHYFNDQSYLVNRLAAHLQKHLLLVEQKLHRSEDLYQELLEIRGICERQSRLDHVQEVQIQLDHVMRVIERHRGDLALIPEGKGTASKLSLNYKRGFEAARSQALQKFLQEIPNLQTLSR